MFTVGPLQGRGRKFDTSCAHHITASIPSPILANHHQACYRRPMKRRLGQTLEPTSPTPPVVKGPVGPQTPPPFSPIRPVMLPALSPDETKVIAEFLGITEKQVRAVEMMIRWKKSGAQ
jgi:hypothetical protein